MAKQIGCRIVESAFFSAGAARQGAMLSLARTSVVRSALPIYVYVAQDGREQIGGAPGGFGQVIIFLAVRLHVRLDAMQEVDGEPLDLRSALSGVGGRESDGLAQEIALLEELLVGRGFRSRPGRRAPMTR
jgi:hypothetical protein